MIDASPASSVPPFDAAHPVAPPVPGDGPSPRRSRRANAIIVTVVVLAALVIVGLVVTLFSGAVFGAGAAGGCGGG
jgi:hypothetical protein